jgi:hypothetical protein
LHHPPQFGRNHCILRHHRRRPSGAYPRRRSQLLGRILGAGLVHRWGSSEMARRPTEEDGARRHRLTAQIFSFPYSGVITMAVLLPITLRRSVAGLAITRCEISACEWAAAVWEALALFAFHSRHPNHPRRPTSPPTPLNYHAARWP